MLDLFQDEYLFTENNVEYWPPVQKPVAAYFPKELKKGDTIRRTSHGSAADTSPRDSTMYFY